MAEEPPQRVETITLRQYMGASSIFQEPTYPGSRGPKTLRQTSLERVIGKLRNLPTKEVTKTSSKLEPLFQEELFEHFFGVCQVDDQIFSTIPAADLELLCNDGPFHNAPHARYPGIETVNQMRQLKEKLGQLLSTWKLEPEEPYFSIHQQSVCHNTVLQDHHRPYHYTICECTGHDISLTVHSHTCEYSGGQPLNIHFGKLISPQVLFFRLIEAFGSSSPRLSRGHQSRLVFRDGSAANFGCRDNVFDDNRTYYTYDGTRLGRECFILVLNYLINVTHAYESEAVFTELYQVEIEHLWSLMTETYGQEFWKR